MADSTRFPALFLGLSSPLEESEKEGKYFKAIQKFVKKNPKPNAIIVMSALWQSETQLEITSWDEKDSFVGDSTLSRSLAYTLKKKGIKSKINTDHSLDYGAYYPISLLYPANDIPIIQFSLPNERTPKTIHKIGLSLKKVREDNILLLGSGNVVHNQKIKHQQKDAQVSGWAKDFDDWVEEKIYDVDKLFNYYLGPNSDYAVPTSEYLDPVYFVLGTKYDDEKAKTLYEGFEFSTTSLRSFEISLL